MTASFPNLTHQEVFDPYSISLKSLLLHIPYSTTLVQTTIIHHVGYNNPHIYHIFQLHLNFQSTTTAARESFQNGMAENYLEQFLE